MRKCFISTYKGEWQNPANVLKKRLGYEIIELKGKNDASISSKFGLLKKETRNIFNIIINFKKINHKKVIICPNYVCLFLAFLQKLHILKAKTICWYGVYVHNPKWIDILGKIVRFITFSEKSFRILVFSKAEIELYAQKWHMDPKYFIYVPYGDWNDSLSIGKKCMGEGYFFSGGYSNRDYIPLIQIFTGRDEKLIIAASKNNVDLCEWVDRHVLSENISIFYDIESAYFNELLCGSKAVIFAMKHNTGASGQMVILSAMAQHKLIITTYTDVLDEYVQNNKTAIVIDKDDMYEALPNIISKVDADISGYEFLIEAAYEKYKRVFSYGAISESLVRSIGAL